MRTRPSYYLQLRGQSRKRTLARRSNGISCDRIRENSARYYDETGRLPRPSFILERFRIKYQLVLLHWSDHRLRKSSKVGRSWCVEKGNRGYLPKNIISVSTKSCKHF